MADFQYITELGVIVPDTEVIDAQVKSEWREAIGEDLIVEPETPQGAIISAIVEGRDSVARNNAELAMQINPDIAGGRWLDAIGSLTFHDRLRATYSVLSGVVLTGIPNTIVQAGSIAVTEGGEQFKLSGTVQISGDGTTIGQFVAVNPGPIAVAPEQLRLIATAVLGWETVSNPVAATVGRFRQSDAAFRRSRRLQLGAQASGSLVSILGKVRAVEGVVSAVGRENVQSTTETIDGLELVPHSVFVVVDGGDDEDVARAILEGKDGGSNYNGGTVVSIVEPISGQTYDVQFERPAIITVQVRVTARFNNLDGDAIIRDAIQQYVNGDLENETPLNIGVPVSPFEISGAINQVEPRIFVTKVELSTDGLTWLQQEIPIALDEKAGIANVQVIPA